MSCSAVPTTKVTLPRLDSVSSNQKNLIHDVVKRSLIELSLSLAIGTITIAFTATALQGALIIGAIAVQTICNIMFRYAGTMAGQDPNCKESRWIASASAYLCPTFFDYLTAYNGQILLHEAGHAATASLLFKNANPKITMTPYLGGKTTFNTAKLTQFGENLGKSGAMFLVTLMGPACTLLVSTIAIAVGCAVQEKFPELSSYFICTGKRDFHANSFYALSALLSSPFEKAHDYARLATYGIHPLASALFLLMMPIVITKTMHRSALRQT